MGSGGNPLALPVMRGAIVQLIEELGIVLPNIIPFQYNPQKVTRTGRISPSPRISSATGTVVRSACLSSGLLASALALPTRSPIRPFVGITSFWIAAMREATPLTSASGLPASRSSVASSSRVN